jgi:hypothetical protein
MTKPDWFILIEQWVPQRMGEHGVTLPFLVGALAHKAGQTDTGVEQVHKILDDIVRHPVEGYVTEVSWCSNISAPVLNTKKVNAQDRMSLEATIPRPSGDGESIVFSLTLRFQWDLKDARALLARLLEDAAEPVSKGCYSRNRKNGTLEFEYSDFPPKELRYIEDTIMHGRKGSKGGNH